MRLSSVVFAVILLFSSVVFAQHSSSSSAPSSPPPSAAPSSPPPAPAPSTASSASSSSSSSAGSSASSYHSSAPNPSPSPSPSPSGSSSGAASSAGSGHSSAPSSASPSSSPSSHISSAPAAPVSEPAVSRSSPRQSEPDPGRINPEPKLSGSEGRIVPSPRLGEIPATKAQEPKSADPDLRRAICKDGPCREPLPKPLESRENVLRNPIPVPICKNPPCECPPGQAHGKNGGCIASSITNRVDQCQPGEYSNGANCITTAQQCPPNERWNGTSCVASLGQCAAISGRSALQVAEARSTRTRMQAECSKNPAGQECLELKQSYEGAVQRYRMLLNEAPVECRTTLPDPLSL
jgi:hypothetical protein